MAFGVLTRHSGGGPFLSVGGVQFSGALGFKISRAFPGVARSTAYYQERERQAVVDEILAQRVKHLIDQEPYLGYRMVWARLRADGLNVNRKAVQRIMQIKRWQCHRRLRKRCSPRVEASSRIAQFSNVRWVETARLF